MYGEKNKFKDDDGYESIGKHVPNPEVVVLNDDASTEPEVPLTENSVKTIIETAFEKYFRSAPSDSATDASKAGDTKGAPSTDADKNVQKG